MDDRALGDLLRELAPQVLGVLVRRYGQFGACEDATQEALLQAVSQWPARGVPDHPRAWLVTVASRRLIDDLRSEHARRRRELDQGPRRPRWPGPRTTPSPTRTTAWPCCSCAATRPCRGRARSRSPCGPWAG